MCHSLHFIIVLHETNKYKASCVTVCISLLYFIRHTNIRLLVSQVCISFIVLHETHKYKDSCVTVCISFIVLHMKHKYKVSCVTVCIALLYFMRHTNTRQPCHRLHLIIALHETHKYKASLNRLNLIIALHETHKYKTSLPQTESHYCTS